MSVMQKPTWTPERKPRCHPKWNRWWSDPRGLLTCFADGTPNIPGAVATIDHSTGAAFWGPYVGQGHFGKAFVLPTGGSAPMPRISASFVGQNPYYQRDNDEVTVAVLSMHTGSFGAYSALYGAMDVTPNNSRVIANLGGGGGGMDVRGYIYVNSTGYQTSSALSRWYANTEPKWHILRWKSGDYLVLERYSLRGELESSAQSSTTITGSLTPLAFTSNSRHMIATGSYNEISGVYDLLVDLPVRLTDEEVAQWLRDPFGPWRNMDHPIAWASSGVPVSATMGGGTEHLLTLVPSITIATEHGVTTITNSVVHNAEALVNRVQSRVQNSELLARLASVLTPKNSEILTTLAQTSLGTTEQLAKLSGEQTTYTEFLALLAPSGTQATENLVAVNMSKELFAENGLLVVSQQTIPTEHPAGTGIVSQLHEIATEHVASIAGTASTSTEILRSLALEGATSVEHLLGLSTPLEASTEHPTQVSAAQTGYLEHIWFGTKALNVSTEHLQSLGVRAEELTAEHVLYLTLGNTAASEHTSTAQKSAGVSTEHIQTALTTAKLISTEHFGTLISQSLPVEAEHLFTVKVINPVRGEHTFLGTTGAVKDPYEYTLYVYRTIEGELLAIRSLDYTLEI